MRTSLFFIILLILLFPFNNTNAQNAFYDAIKLRNYTNEDGDLKSVQDTVYFILDNYIEPEKKNTIHELDSILRSEENPFFVISGSARSQVDDNKTGNFFSSILPGGGSATIIADGIGKFLAKRTKQELNILFFDRFREFLNTHPEIAQLFPSTAILLNSILNQEYPNLLSTLRAAFDSDLKAILRNIAAIADIDDGAACENCSTESKKKGCRERLKTIQKFLTDSDQGRALVAGLLIADGAISKQNPADILSSIVGNNTIRKINGDVYNSLSFLNIFSQSLRSDDLSEIWISSNERKLLVDDPVTLNIYLGLIYEQIKNKQITIGGQSIAATYITPTNVSSLKKYIEKILDAGKQLELSYKKFKEVENDSTSLKLSHTSKFVGAVHSFFDIAIQYNTIHPTIPGPNNSTKQIFLYVDTSLSVVQKILAKEYYGAVLSTTVLLENVLKTRDDFNDKGQLISSDMNTALTKKQFLRSFLRYSNFAANVVAAENSDDVEKAIEAIALPPGSASIKRTTNFNLAFQAYTGFVGGDINEQKGTFNSVSVYAPIGIAFSIGLRPSFRPRFAGTQNPENKKNWGSLTLFASIIDVGAFVSYRFYHPDENFSDSVNISWANIFAPGVNLVYGIPKWPISIGFGAQYQASLRKVDAATATIVEKSGLRYNFFLALDLPLINLYTSKR